MGPGGEGPSRSPPPVSPAMSERQHCRDNAHSVFVLDNDLHNARLCCT